MNGYTQQIIESKLPRIRYRRASEHVEPTRASTLALVKEMGKGLHKNRYLARKSERNAARAYNQVIRHLRTKAHYCATQMRKSCMMEG